jgi:tetratricopeptide (TPR) repeat protein
MGVASTLAKISIDQALLKAKSHAQKGEIQEATKLYQSVLQAFPKNIRAQQGLAALSKPRHDETSRTPPQDVIDQLLLLYKRGHLSAVVAQAQNLKEQYPHSYFVWNIFGAANKGLGQIEDAVNSVNGKAKVSQRAEQNVATFGLA